MTEVNSSVLYVKRTCDKQTSDAFQFPRLTVVIFMSGYSVPVTVVKDRRTK